MDKIHLPPVYRLELLASEPMIKEPVAITWDGNGRMYVAEMRTYMQDIDGMEIYLFNASEKLLKN